MAAISSRGRGRRRTINEINMVPFIDVMLVLLIIFMVSAPLITTGVVDLPSVGRSKTQPPHVIHLTMGTDERIQFKLDDGAEEKPVALANVAEVVKLSQGGDAEIPVVISADKAVKYEAVVKLMDTLQRADIKRVGLAVRNSGQ
ncbi:biopolymer transporter ExbD [Burkholderiaceae bacterium UC74_6]